jgi:hypothetical protein
MKGKKMVTEDMLNEESLEMILELTPVARLYLEAESSATLVNALSEDMTMLNLLKRKSDLQQSLAHSNPLLPTLDTLPKNGKTTVLKKDYWVSRLPAY